MQKILLLLFLFLLNGCSLNSILAFGEVDKVQVVKKNASVSHYRAYFTRTQLKPISHGQKYIFFYNKKKKDLAILLYKYQSYTLYSLFHPNKKLSINASSKISYRQIKKILHQRGYYKTSPRSIGISTKVALRRFKGIKTLLVEVKKYHKTKNKKQKIKVLENTSDEEILIKKTPEINKTSVLPFSYYSQKSSSTELGHYLSEDHTQDNLSFTQYNQLKKRLRRLKEEKLLREGSLEALISAYKINKKPRYKQRILQLMKEAQK